MVDDVVQCEGEDRLQIASDNNNNNVTKLIPFPEPGTWYLGLQVGEREGERDKDKCIQETE